MTPKKSGQSQEHHRPSLEKTLSEPVQLVDSIEGLDEFASEPDPSLQIEVPAMSTPMPEVIPDGTDTDVSRILADVSRILTDVRRLLTDVSRIHLWRFDWTRHAGRAALVGSVLTAAVAGILVLQPPATPPPAVDPAEPTIDSAPPLTMADSPKAPPLVISTASRESPSVKARVQSQAIPRPKGNLRGTQTPTVRDTGGRPIPKVMAPSVPLARSATTAVPAPRGFVAVDAPIGALSTPAESTAAVAGSSSLSTPPLAAAVLTPSAPTSTVSPPAPTLGADPRAASPPAETFRSATEVPVDAVARPTGRQLDARAIENVLGRYRSAFNRLDAGAAVAVWPTVNEKTLARAFERLDDQDVSFESCKIHVGGVHAEAACNGTARYVPKVGSRTTKAEARQWRFTLRRAMDGWVIDNVDAR